MHKLHLASFVILSLFAFSFTMIPDAYAITYTAVADGIWYDDATWGKSNPGNPNSDDEVIIPDGIIVTLTKDVTNDGTITVDGELDLSASKITNTESGIVDVNNYLIIGNSGTLENDKGTININEGGDGILISAGGLLENKNSISVLNIGNSFIDNYGTISNTGTIQCISNTEPEINNFGTITNNGGAILGNSANFYLYNEGGTITNDGTITATIEQYGASLFTNQNSGIIIDDSDDSYIENNGGTFDNDGTIHVGDFNNNFIFENHGTLILNNFFNGEAGTTFTTFSGSTSTINRFENTATITNGGVFSTNVGSLNYGTIVNDGTFTNAGTFGNFGPFTNNGTFEQKATVVGTVLISGNSVASLIDSDVDGIWDVIDLDSSDNANDSFSDGDTNGNITTRGDHTLMISDESDEDKGVRIVTGVASGKNPTEISVCKDLSQVSISADSNVVITCGSVYWNVFSGTITNNIISIDGDPLELSLSAGDAFYFNDDDFTFTAITGTAKLSFSNTDGILTEISVPKGVALKYDSKSKSIKNPPNGLESIQLLIDGKNTAILASGNATHTITNGTQNIDARGIHSSEITLTDGESSKLNDVSIFTDDAIVTIPQNTEIVSGDTSLEFTESTKTPTLPKNAQVGKVLEFGNEAGSVVFSNMIKITLPQQGGQIPFYVDHTGETNLISLCGGTPNNAAQAAVDSTIAGGARECYFTLGSTLIIWTYHFTGYGSFTPGTGGGGNCDGDCIPPTLGVTNDGKRRVSSGFSYNDNPVDVELFFTPFSLISVNVGEQNKAEFKIFENSGPENVRHFDFAFGLSNGEILSDSKVRIEWEKSFDGTEITHLIDPENVLENVSVDSEIVSCGNTEDKCMSLTIYHTFRAPLDFDIVATNVWDHKRNTWQNYYNHGVHIEGESLNPAKQIDGINKGHIYHLTETGKDAAVDEFGNSWSLQYDAWSMDYIQNKKIIDGIEMDGYSRDNSMFDTYKNGQSLLSEYKLGEICPKCLDESFGEISDISSIDISISSESKLDDSLIQEIMYLESEKAEKLLNESFHTLYSGRHFIDSNSIVEYVQLHNDGGHDESGPGDDDNQ